MTALYGLPEQVLFCKKCVVSNQRPSSTPEFLNVGQPKQTIHFDSEGVCDACRVAEAKAGIDWSERGRELRELCERYCNADGRYDCLIPGSGGKDSFYAAHVLKTQYGMHPLLVTWSAHIYTDWGLRNLERFKAIADHIQVTPRADTHRLLTRLAVDNLFHPFQPFILGQKGMPPKIAKQMGIKLVFYGENEAEYGNPKDQTNRAERERGFYAGSESLAISGLPIAEILERYSISRGDLDIYLPLETAEEVDVRYLGYYLKWHPQSAYYHAVENGGFECAPERTPGTWSKYSSIDDKLDDFHYITTYWKYGIGRATYDAAQEIRSGDITRDEGIALVRRFDGEYPERFEREVNEYLSVDGFPPMTRERWFMLAEKFRSPHLWDGNQLRYKL